ncbi:MAG: PilZ domain-containing protein [Desulfobacterales bacterium]
MTNAYIEKRSHPRLSTTSRVAFTCFDEKGTIGTRGTGRALNISQGGLLMETYDLVTCPYIRLATLDKEKLPIVFKGRVIYAKPMEGKKFEVGIRFRGNRSQNLDALTRFVKTFCVKRGG